MKRIYHNNYYLKMAALQFAVASRAKSQQSRAVRSKLLDLQGVRPPTRIGLVGGEINLKSLAVTSLVADELKVRQFQGNKV
jgi:hypothetical protein